MSAGERRRKASPGKYSDEELQEIPTGLEDWRRCGIDSAGVGNGARAPFAASPAARRALRRARMADPARGHSAPAPAARRRRPLTATPAAQRAASARGASVQGLRSGRPRASGPLGPGRPGSVASLRSARRAWWASAANARRRNVRGGVRRPGTFVLGARRPRAEPRRAGQPVGACVSKRPVYG
jgi:hypothetical protein